MANAALYRKSFPVEGRIDAGGGENEKIVLHLASSTVARGEDRLERDDLASAVAADLPPADAAVA
jgi:hypothetical protein